MTDPGTPHLHRSGSQSNGVRSPSTQVDIRGPRPQGRAPRIAVFADYILPHPEAGDGQAALSEACALGAAGFDVCVYTHRRADGGPIPALQLSVNGLIVRDSRALRGRAPPDLLIQHQVTDCPAWTEAATRAPLLGRLHIDYDDVARVALEHGFDQEAILTRRPPARAQALQAALVDEATALALVSSDLGISGRSQSPILVVPPRSENAPLPLPAGPIEPRTVVVGGRLHDPIKGAPVLERALRIVLRSAPDTRIVVLGTLAEGDLTRWRKAFGESLSYVGWVREQDECLRVLARATVFLTLPFYEPYGLMVRDAARVGVPVVSTPHGLARELARVDEGVVTVPRASRPWRETAEGAAAAVLDFFETPQGREPRLHRSWQAVHEQLGETPRWSEVVRSLLGEQ